MCLILSHFVHTLLCFCPTIFLPHQKMGVGVGVGIGIGFGIGCDSSISDIAHDFRGVKCLRAKREDREREREREGGQREREELDFRTCLALPW